MTDALVEEIAKAIRSYYSGRSWEEMREPHREMYRAKARLVEPVIQDLVNEIKHLKSQHVPMEGALHALAENVYGSEWPDEMTDTVLLDEASRLLHSRKVRIEGLEERFETQKRSIQQMSEALRAQKEYSDSLEKELDKKAEELQQARGSRVCASIFASREESVPKAFSLYRSSDVTGVSGKGVVATGVQFDDGTVVIRWRGEHASTVVWPSIEDANAVHGHDGKTTIVWHTENVVDALKEIEKASERRVMSKLQEMLDAPQS